MEKDYFKYYHPQFLVGLIIIVFVLVYLAKESFGLSISILGVVTLLIGFITKYFWKYKPFKWLFWIDDFSGRYEGKLCYQYQDENGDIQSEERNHIKIITQTGSKISVQSFTYKLDGTQSSPSINKGMYIEKTHDDQHYSLIYNYLNEGSTEQSFSPHYGTDVVKFIKDGENKKLTGYYYTNRLPFQSKGVFMNLKWVSNKKQHDS